MEASVVDLRYKMNEVLKALDRNEQVTILYHGKVKGVIKPMQPKTTQKVQDHPFFGVFKPEQISVEEKMDQLRGSRYDI